MVFDLFFPQIIASSDVKISSLFRYHQFGFAVRLSSDIFRRGDALL